MTTPTMMAYLPRMVSSSLDRHLAQTSGGSATLDVVSEICSEGRQACDCSTLKIAAQAPVTLNSADQIEGPGFLVRFLPNCAVIFLDIVGFTPLCEVLSSRGAGPGAELLATGLRLYWEVLQGVVARWGGDVIKYAGDALLAVFCPTAGDGAIDCGRAAVQAALDIQASLHEAVFVRGVTFRVRIGVGYGPASLYILGNGLGLSKPVKPSEAKGMDAAHVSGKPTDAASYGRLEFLLVGPAVAQAITAEKLCDAGRVLLSCSAFDAVRSFFSCDAVPIPRHGTQLATSERPSKRDTLESTTTGAVGYVVNASLLPLSTLSLEDGSEAPAATLSKEHGCYNESLQTLVRAALPPALVPHLSPTLEPFANELRSVSVVFVHLAVDPSWLHCVEDANEAKVLSSPQPEVQHPSDPRGPATTSRQRRGRALPSVSSTTRSPVTAFLDDEVDATPVVESPDHRDRGMLSDVKVKVASKAPTAAIRGSVLHKLLGTVRSVCDDHQGDLNKVVLDEKGLFLLLVWGLPPQGHEDDAVRATQAALAISRRLQEVQAEVLQQQGCAVAEAFLSGPICSIGVTSGTAFCGSIGGTQRREYTVSGDLVNCCARLMATAKAIAVDGRPYILVDGPTRDSIVQSPVGTWSIALETLHPLVLKGKAKPVQAYAATCEKPATQARSAITESAPDLVLPDVAAISLVRVQGSVQWPETFSHQQQMIAREIMDHMGSPLPPGSPMQDGYDCLWLTGEAGIGKTFAVHDVLAWAASVWRVKFGCPVRIGFEGELSAQPAVQDADMLVVHCSAASMWSRGDPEPFTCDGICDGIMNGLRSSLAFACACQLVTLINERSPGAASLTEVGDDEMQHPSTAARCVLRLLSSVVGSDLPSATGRKVCLVLDEMHLASAADWEFVAALVHLQLQHRLKYPAGDRQGRGSALILLVSRDPPLLTDAATTTTSSLSALGTQIPPLDKAQLQLFGLMNVRLLQMRRLDAAGIMSVVARMLDTVPGPLAVLRSSAPAAVRERQSLSESLRRQSLLFSGAAVNRGVTMGELTARPVSFTDESQLDRQVTLLHTVPESLATLLHALSGGHPSYACNSLQALIQVGLVRIDAKEVQVVVPSNAYSSSDHLSVGTENKSGVTEDVGKIAPAATCKWNYYNMSVRTLSTHVKPTDFLPLPYQVQRSISSRVDRLTAHALLTLKTASVLCFGAGQTHTSFTMEDVLRVYPAALPSKVDSSPDVSPSRGVLPDSRVSVLRREVEEVLSSGLVVRNLDAGTDNELRPGTCAGDSVAPEYSAQTSTRAFDCAITRDVLYHTMLYTQRRRLHRAAAYMLLQRILCSLPDSVVQLAQQSTQDAASGPAPPTVRKAKGLSRRRSSAAEQALHARRESGGYQFHYLTLSEEHDAGEPNSAVKTATAVGVSPGGSGPALPTQILAASKLLVHDPVLSHSLAMPAARELACIAYRHLALAGERMAADLLFEHYVRARTGHRTGRRGTSQPEEEAPFVSPNPAGYAPSAAATSAPGVADVAKGRPEAAAIRGLPPGLAIGDTVQSAADQVGSSGALTQQTLAVSGPSVPRSNQRAGDTGSRSARGRCSSAPPVPDAMLVEQSDKQGQQEVDPATHATSVHQTASRGSRKKGRQRAVSAGPSPSGPPSSSRAGRTPRTPVFRLHRLPFTSFRLIYRGAAAVATGAVAGAASVASAASTIGSVSVHGAMSIGSAVGTATVYGARTLATGVHRGVSLTAQGLTSVASTVTSMAGTALVVSARGMYSLASMPTSMLSRRDVRGRQGSREHLALDTTAALADRHRTARTNSSDTAEDASAGGSACSSSGQVQSGPKREKPRRRLSLEDKLSVLHHSAFRVNLPGMSTSSSASPQESGKGVVDETSKLAAFTGVRTGSSEGTAPLADFNAGVAGSSATADKGTVLRSGTSAAGSSVVQFPGRPPRRSRASSCIPMVDMVFGCSGESAVAVDDTALGVAPAGRTGIVREGIKPSPNLSIPAYVPSAPSAHKFSLSPAAVARESAPTYGVGQLEQSVGLDQETGGLGPSPRWNRLHTLPAAVSLGTAGASLTSHAAASSTYQGDGYSPHQARTKTAEGMQSLRPTLAACDSQYSLTNAMLNENLPLQEATDGSDMLAAVSGQEPPSIGGIQQGAWRRDRARRNTNGQVAADGAAATPASVQDRGDTTFKARQARSASIPKYARVLGQEAAGHHQVAALPVSPAAKGRETAQPNLSPVLLEPSDAHTTTPNVGERVLSPPRDTIRSDRVTSGLPHPPSTRVQKSRTKSHGARHRRCSVAAQQLRAQPIVHTHGLSLQQWVHGLGSSRKDLVRAGLGTASQQAQSSAAGIYDGTNRRGSAFDVSGPAAALNTAGVPTGTVPSQQFTPKKHRPRSGQARVAPVMALDEAASSQLPVQMSATSGAVLHVSTPADAMAATRMRDPPGVGDCTRAPLDSTVSTVYVHKGRPFSAASCVTATSSNGHGAISSLDYEDQQRQHSLLHITRSLIDAGFVYSHAEGEVVVSAGDEPDQIAPAAVDDTTRGPSRVLVSDVQDEEPASARQAGMTSLALRTPMGATLPGQLASPLQSTTSRGRNGVFSMQVADNSAATARQIPAGLSPAAAVHSMPALPSAAHSGPGTTNGQRRRHGATGFAGSRRLSSSAFDMLADKRGHGDRSDGAIVFVPPETFDLHAQEAQVVGGAPDIGTLPSAGLSVHNHRDMSTDTVFVASCSGSIPRQVTGEQEVSADQGSHDDRKECPSLSDEGSSAALVLRSAQAFAATLGKTHISPMATDSVRSWFGFDVFSLECASLGFAGPACTGLPATLTDGQRLTGNGPMVAVMQLILSDIGSTTVDAPARQAVLSAASVLQAGYLPGNPYHNATHAADVAQACYALLTGSNKQASYIQGIQLPSLGPGQILSAVLAALAHDYGHPGVGGAALAALGHPIALSGMYAAPVLENYHAAEAFQAISSADVGAADVFQTLAQLQGCRVADVRGDILRMILVTSLAEQPSWLASFDSELTSITAVGSSSRLAVGRIQQLAVKAADLGNCAKPVPTAREWSLRVMREFHCQGTSELALSLPVSRFMDRRAAVADVAACQAGFSRHIALPLFKVVAQVWPGIGHEALRQVERSAALWEAAGRTLIKL